MLSIVTTTPEYSGYPSILRRACAPVDVEAWGDDLAVFIERMFAAQYAGHGVGLAAPQVGYDLRLAVVDDRRGEPVALINPEIVDRDDRLDASVEGCLSLPGYLGEVERATRVVVETTRLDGARARTTFSGYAARVVQHETDHLDGILFLDRLRSGTSVRRATPEDLAASAMRSLAS